MKFVFYFYWVAIIMLSNRAFFSWLLQGALLGVWRQVLWGMGLLIVALNMKNIVCQSPRSVQLIKHQICFALIVFVLSLFSWALLGTNLVRLGYAFWIYFSGIPFLLFPYFYLFRKSTPAQFFNVFVFLGTFLSVGILVDYLLGGKITVALGVAGFKTTDDIRESGRYCFLSEAPTTFSMYYVFCMICVWWKLYMSKSQLHKFLLFLLLFLYIVGAWFTGSRQIVAVLGGSFMVIFTYYTLFVRDTKKYLLSILLIACLGGGVLYARIHKDEAYQTRYSSSVISKDSRMILWEKGYKKTFGSPDWGVFLYGKGVGLTQGQKALKGEPLDSHYECTFISRMLDVGIIGVIMLLYPIFMFLRQVSVHRFSDCLLSCFFMSYFFISLVSPNGAHQTTQMVVFLALGLLVNKKDFFTKDENE